jgi:thioredoxin 1
MEKHGDTCVVTADDGTFEREGLQSAVPVLVDFGGRWCGPCKALAPIVEKIAADHGGKLKVVAVDVDDSPEVARRYGIRGVPTVAVFRAGKESGKIMGLTSREKLLALAFG